MIPDIRCGIGYDVHRLVDGRDLIIGGVKIPHSLGLLGHSDADVLIHAIMDALLGAASLGDIGTHFPDSDKHYDGISSIRLLEHVYALLSENGFSIINIDSVIQCQAPKLMPHAEKMKENIATALGTIDVSRIGIKGTTTEKLGFVGREEGIAAEAVCLVFKEK